MNENPEFSDFLAEVDALHDEQGTVQTTAHTSSVSADGWNSQPVEPTED